MPTSCGQQRRSRSSAPGSCWPSAARWSGWTPPLLLHAVPQNRPPFPTPSPLGSECAKAVPQATIVAEFFPSTVRAANAPPPINSCHGQPSTHLPGAVGLNAGCQGSPERIRPEAPPPPHRRQTSTVSPNTLLDARRVRLSTVVLYPSTSPLAKPPASRTGRATKPPCTWPRRGDHTTSCPATRSTPCLWSVMWPWAVPLQEGLRQKSSLLLCLCFSFSLNFFLDLKIPEICVTFQNT
jgi:hypothetical protein